MIFSQDNVGRLIVMGQVEQKISKVAASGEWFRIESEENGPIVHDYGLKDIASANVITISFDGGAHWMDISVAQA